MTELQVEKHPIILTAYGLGTACDDWSIVQAPAIRRWMDQTRDKFAYRCLPLRQANELGYWILCPTDVTVLWDGTENKTGLKVTVAEDRFSSHIKSHFGSGILTFNIPWLFRTNMAGLGLRVGGATNSPPPIGLYPLDGLVETWEQNSTFTMNWKVLEAGRQLIIRAGYPICAISFYDWWSCQIPFKGLRLQDLDPKDRADYEAWRTHRASVLEGEPLDNVRNHYTKGQRVQGGAYLQPHWIRLNDGPVNYPYTVRPTQFYNPISTEVVAAKTVSQATDLLSAGSSTTMQQDWYKMIVRLRTELAYTREPDANLDSFKLDDTTQLEHILELENADMQFLAIQALKTHSVAQGFEVPQNILDLEITLCQ